jgi:hypothetical protein
MRDLKPIALLTGLLVCVSAAAVQAQGSPNPSPGVILSVTLPDGQNRELATHESGLATVTVGGREYGFRPTMHDDAGTRMTITIFDMGSPSEAVRELGAVDVRGGGPAVSSKTSPVFKVLARKGSLSPTT